MLRLRLRDEGERAHRRRLDASPSLAGWREGDGSKPPNGALRSAGTVSSGAARPVAVVMSAGVRRWRVEDRVEGILRTGGVVAVGLGQVAKRALAAHDGDGRVGQAGEIARQVAHVRPATVFIVGEVAHVVHPVFDVPVVPDQRQELPGRRARRRAEVRQ